MYKILIQSDAAGEFFRLLLSQENRTYFRNQFQDVEIIKAYGCSDYCNCNRIIKNNKTLLLYSNILPVGIIVEYHKRDTKIQNFDKLLLWEMFPAEDNEKLEGRVDSAYNEKKRNSFFQIDILLYSGNVKTASTDLKSNEASLEDSKRNCQSKYEHCSIHAFANEEEFSENILYVLMPSTLYEKKDVSFQLNDIITKKEEELQSIYYLYDYEMEFLSNQNGILNSEQLYSICDWKNIVSKQNIVEAYFDAFISSVYYEAVLDEIVSYYRRFIKDICIWNEKDDYYNLAIKITKELLHKRDIFCNNALSAPKTKLEYISNKIYTNKILEFNKAILEFFSDDVKNIFCSHISEKIKTYRGLLK